MMVYKILLDDMRSDGMIPNGTNLPMMDLIIRTPAMFDSLIPILMTIEFVLFLDHDFGLDDKCHYAKDGYKMLMEMFDLKIFPHMIKLVTANPVGRKNIEAALRQTGYNCNGIGEWTR
jgi:hypothetical protein